MKTQTIQKILEKEAEYLLDHKCKAIPKEALHQPSPDHIHETFQQSDRSLKTINAIEKIYDSGRLKGTGYCSILPVDQAIEHSAASVFAKNPTYFDPEYMMNLAIQGGCSAVASTYGALAIIASKYADKIPFIVKLNHNELLSYPNFHDETGFASVRQAKEMGATAVGATIYFGSKDSRRQIQEISTLFEQAHQEGMATVLWCYVRNDHFPKTPHKLEEAADLTAQAIHLGVTIGADIVKQKLPSWTGGYAEIDRLDKENKYGKYNKEMEKLTTDHPIDQCRYQVAHAYMGRIGLVSSGGPSGGENDLHDAVRQAVINKRAGGHGLILGRKAFQRPLQEGIEILNAVQDVYRNKEITIA